MLHYSLPIRHDLQRHRWLKSAFSRSDLCRHVTAGGCVDTPKTSVRLSSYETVARFDPSSSRSCYARRSNRNSSLFPAESSLRTIRLRGGVSRETCHSAKLGRSACTGRRLTLTRVTSPMSDVVPRTTLLPFTGSPT